MTRKKQTTEEPQMDEMNAPETRSRRIKRKSAEKSVKDSGTKSLASGAFIILLVLIVVTGLSLTLTTKASKNIDVLGPQGITVNLDLSSPVFREAYTNGTGPEYCNDPKPYKGISNSMLFLSSSNSKPLGSIKLGDAVKYTYVSCKFKAFLPLDDSFIGGKVSVYVKFPFGESETFIVDVGNQRPYKIDLKLNLG